MLGRVLASTALIVLGVLAGLALSEGLLACARFPKGGSVASGWARDDLDARYSPRPGIYPKLFGAEVRINALGMRGPKVDRADVLLLGDSCTFGVGVRDERTFAGLLRARGLAVANAAVPGYNSTSGLARFKEAGLLSLRPRAVVLYFGWNDHRRAAATESFFAALRPWAARFRTAAILLRFQESLIQANTFRGRMRLVPQVPLPEFKENLREMIALSRAAGAAAIVVTAASEPADLSTDTAPISVDYRDYHARYVQAAREVAAETGATLLDFERQVALLPETERAPLFADFVHFSEKGHRVFARELLTALAGLGVKPPRR